MMNIKLIQAFIVLILSQINNHMICACRKPTPAISPTIKILKKQSKGNLAREVVTLRDKLASRSSGENVYDSDLELGIPRTRSNSLSTSENKLCERLGESIDHQTTLHQRLAHSQEQQVRFQEKVYNDFKCSRRIVVLGTLFSIAYTTAGFIWQNWPAISSVFGHHSGGGNTGSGTNSTGV